MDGDHPLPVCFTTNYMERVDTASLRRFTFQIVLSYLDKPGLRRAWQVFFGSVRVPPEAVGIANLTPGNFAKVRKQASGSPRRSRQPRPARGDHGGHQPLETRRAWRPRVRDVI